MKKKQNSMAKDDFSPEVRKEIRKWKADPKKYWWEHSGKRTLHTALVLLAIAMIIIIIASNL
jgi:hypothetical protein